LPGASDVECGEAIAVIALNAGTISFTAKRANLSVRFAFLQIGWLTSFHLFRGTASAPSTGSIYMAFPTPTSGIQIAHSRWDQGPVLVCLKAPPSLGQKMQDWR
jgi:hypothetical protein